MMAAIAEKRFSDRSDHHHFSAIVAITTIVATKIAEIASSSIPAIVATQWRSLRSYGNHSPEIVPCDGKYTRMHCVLYLFKMTSDSVADFMDEVQRYDCLYNRFSRDYNGLPKTPRKIQGQRVVEI